MNIFVLDKDPEKCAKMHCDRHVVKMILETAQLMCTAHHIKPNISMLYKIPYKKTHTNHPCAKWVRDSLSNYKWLYRLAYHLNEEYKHRYNKSVNHKSFDVIDNLPFPRIKDNGLTRWARAMPDKCKVGNDVVKSYRKYYNEEKQDIITYKNREKPNWLIQIKPNDFV